MTLLEVNFDEVCGAGTKVDSSLIKELKIS